MAMTPTNIADEDEWEFQQPFEICPWDIWITIIEKYLTDPKDIVNLSKSSSEMKHAILKLHPALFFAEVFQHVAPYLERKDVRKCRNVSRHWNKLVVAYMDGFNDSVSSVSKFPYVNHGPGEVSITDLDEIDRWEKEMEPTLTNPVVCRSLRLHVTSRDETNEFVARSIHHLSTWGHYTRDLTITMLYSDPITAMDFLGFVHSCLRHVPNLKTLVLEYVEPTETIQQEAVQEWLESHPFPSLPFLCHFQLCPLYGNELVWKGLLATYQYQLETLSARLPPCLSATENFNVSFSRLTKLIMFLPDREMSALREMAERSDWSLKYLQLKWYGENPLTKEQRVNFQRLLQQSESTLEFLLISKVCINEECFAGVILPRLKNFRILDCTLQSLDFLIEFSPGLKNLTVFEKFASRLDYYFGLPVTNRPESPNVLNLYNRNGWQNLWNGLRSLAKIHIYWSWIGGEDEDMGLVQGEKHYSRRNMDLDFFEG